MPRTYVLGNFFLYMKAFKLFISVCFILFSLIGHSQKVDFQKLLTLQKGNLQEIEDFFVDYDYKLYEAKTDAKTKKDTISFIYDDGTTIGFTKFRSNFSIYINDLTERSYRIFYDEMKSMYFKMISSKVGDKNSVNKVFISEMCKCEIIVSTEGAINHNGVKNVYSLLVNYPNNFSGKYRKHLIK